MKTLLLSLSLACLLGCNRTNTTEPTPGCQATPNNNCACTQVIDPVCGCDGVTYTSPCLATCAGVTYTKGACK